MPGDDRARGMKSAYELALEKLEALGVERPREAALSEETKRAIAEARRYAESKLAELEILHRDKLSRLPDLAQRTEQEEYYRREQERLRAECEAAVARLRASG